MTHQMIQAIHVKSIGYLYISTPHAAQYTASKIERELNGQLTKRNSEGK